MRSIIIFIALVFLLPASSLAQDSLARLQYAWKGLGRNMQMRNEVALAVFARITTGDSVALAPGKSAAIEMNSYFDPSKTPDSLLAAGVKKLNSTITDAVTKTLALIEKDPALKNNDEVKNLVSTLVASGSRLSSAKNRYHEICLDLKRKDLLID